MAGSDQSESTEGDAATAAERRHRRSVLETFTSPDSYGLLFILIVLTYGVTVAIHGNWAGPVILMLAIVTLWLALNTSAAHRVVRLVANALLILAAVAVVVGLVEQKEETIGTLVSLVGLFLYFLAPWVIVRHLVERRGIDVQTLLGAICAYLLIGMFFAYLFQFLGRVQGTPFFGPQGDGNPASFLFFSFTTLTTTGYGNLVPAGNPGQSFAVIEMILGPLFLIGTLGKVVAEWKPGQGRAQRGGSG